MGCKSLDINCFRKLSENIYKFAIQIIFKLLQSKKSVLVFLINSLLQTTFFWRERCFAKWGASNTAIVTL